jgi:Uma2 family endonuclease
MSVAAWAPVTEPVEYIIDDLDWTPDDGNRYETLGGVLVVSPAPAINHQVVCQRLWLALRNATGSQVQCVLGAAVRLPNGDGPIPDISVTDAELSDYSKWLPAARVQTAVEVVSPSNARTDRVLKPALYANAGIPCYWRVELASWRAYRGATPLIAVRVLHRGDWHTVTAVAGITAELPLAVGRQVNGSAMVVTVKLDPAELIAPGK